MTLSVAAGTLIDGRYRVLSRVGSGGMADVYCAEDEQLGRRVAVKMLHERFAADEEFVERFRREASSAAGLSHANIVNVYDRGEWGGTYYIAMEYLDGRSLDSIVREEAPLPPRRAIEITEQVLRAARFAHRRGVVHRDLKPHNVIVDDEGRVKVTDFGIARAGASEITQTGSIMGTARYLSPEQAQGQPVSARSDLYSIGVMLYELLTGAVPFEGDSVVAIALRHLSEPPRVPSSLVPSISPSLDAIVLRALAKDPEQRFADADEFLAALADERVRLDNDPASQTAALAPIVLPPPPAPPIAYPHPATYTTQSLSPVSGMHPRTGVSWWDPATGQVPPGTVILPAAGGRQRGPVWPWALLGVIVVAAAAVAVVLLLAKHPAHTAVTGTTVPNVIGESVVVASGNLQQFGYVPKQKLVASQAPQGTVIFQNPRAGSKLAAHATVRLFVSKGAQPTTLQVPTVVGLAVHTAEHRLHGSRFKTSVVRQPSTTVPKDKVISTNPGAGSTVPRGSTVVLTVSSGQPPALVPDVVGQTKDQATFLLQQDKFVIGKVTEQTTTQQPPGTVLAQSPRPGKAQQGATVNLTVAQAPPNVKVPELLGLKRKEAKGRLTALGLTAVVTKVVRDVNPQYSGEVISQQPSAGASIAPGTSVTITIEVYKAPVGPTGSSGPTGSTGTGGTPPPSGATGPG